MSIGDEAPEQTTPQPDDRKGEEVKYISDEGIEKVFDGLVLLEEATGLKEKGNERVKRKDYHAAVKIYEEAIEVLGRGEGYSMLHDEVKQINALKSLLYGNIAQCMLNEKFFQRAVEAATNALILDESNLKALHRRSLAHEGEKDITEALKDALALRQKGGGAMSIEECEKRCDMLLEKQMAIGRVLKTNEDMFSMKAKFDEVVDKYDLADIDFAPEVARMIVTDKDLGKTVAQVAKRYKMEKDDAEHLAKWISKGLEMKVIPDPLAQGK